MTDARTLARLIADAGRTVIFTGAGLSTESGIPDFRSPGGVWTTMQPITYPEFIGSRASRKQAWGRVFANSAGWVGAEPNAGHTIVADLVRTGAADLVITQNVDNLHQRAGTPPERVIELHGNASYATCLDCGERYELQDLRPRWETGDDISCDHCGGLIKTATIAFGQSLPQDRLARAIEAARRAELFVVLGSSLVVNPAATLPLLAKQAGADLVIVNRDPTPLDSYADLRVTRGLGEVLTETVAELAALSGA